MSDADLASRILDLLSSRDGDKTICPSEVARDVAGSDEKKWRLLMTPIRHAAVALAREGQIELRRKGRPVDPAELRGIYRIGRLSSGPGSS